MNSFSEIFKSSGDLKVLLHPRNMYSTMFDFDLDFFGAGGYFGYF